MSKNGDIGFGNNDRIVTHGLGETNNQLLVEAGMSDSAISESTGDRSMNSIHDYRNLCRRTDIFQQKILLPSSTRGDVGDSKEDYGQCQKKINSNDGESVTLGSGDLSGNSVSSDRLLDIGKKILQSIGTMNTSSVTIKFILMTNRC